MIRLRLTALVLVGASGLGCRVARPLVPPPPLERPVASGLVSGRSAQGREIEAVVMGEGPVAVLVIASIHGDETAGSWIVRALIEHLEDDPRALEGRLLVAVPVVNPDGVAAGTRTNARGVDLNRDFPAANQRRPGDPPTEPESRFLLELVERYRPARILTFHQAANRLDYDGPAQGLAEAMAAVCPLEVARMGARPGSLGSWAGVDLGLPVITVELPRQADQQAPSRRWELYGEMLRVALRYPEAPLPGGPGSAIP